MKLIPAKNPEKGGIYFFKRENNLEDPCNGHEILIVTKFNNDYAEGADLNLKNVVGVYKNELFEKSSHLYRSGDIVHDDQKNYKGRIFQVLKPVLDIEGYYSAKCVREPDNKEYQGSIPLNKVGNFYLDNFTSLFVDGDMLAKPVDIL